MTAVAHPARARRASLGRLTAVELRKMIDTRAGRWLLATIGLLVLATVVTGTLIHDSDVHRMAGLFEFALLPFALLTPVLAILSVTSEWSQRTALATFSLVPARERVAVAKLLAVAVLGVLGVLVCGLAAAAGNLAIGESWAFGWNRVAEALLFGVLSTLTGFAFGLLCQSSALAIVVAFAVPTAWSILVETLPPLAGVAPWLDTSPTMNRLSEATMGSGTHWARLATSFALWLVLPAALGLWRLRRSELK